LEVSKASDATIEIPVIWRPLRGMKVDVALMELFKNKNFMAKEMKDINRCRMYLRAFYLSDIADIDGH
jgi:hypothetical protein